MSPRPFPAADRGRPRWRRHVTTAALLAVVVAAFALSLLLAPAPDGDAEAFVGADATATATVEESHPDYTPWFEPLFAPSSGEVESGLFALQAGVGGVALGFVLGRLRSGRAHPVNPAPAGPPPADAT
ncbi:energy-coupling factor ABC transporter substrate-binding protein [Thalassiella azotivora]